MVCRKNNFCDQHPLMTIQTDLSSVRHVFHDRMPTNRRQSECALKLPGLRPSSWMLAALAGGGAVDGGLTAMVKVLGGEGFVCVNTWGFKNFDSNQIGSTDIKQSAVAASESALPGAHEVLELTLRVADAPAIRIGERDWKVLGTRDISKDSATVTSLLLRDEASGQIDYRQSVLRFVLIEGQDYEAFIRSRSQATRVFVNPLYGDIAVDASRIAVEYADLAGDPRVSKMMFVPLEVSRTSK